MGTSRLYFISIGWHQAPPTFRTWVPFFSISFFHSYYCYPSRDSGVPHKSINTAMGWWRQQRFEKYPGCFMVLMVWGRKPCVYLGTGVGAARVATYVPGHSYTMARNGVHIIRYSDTVRDSDKLNVLFQYLSDEFRWIQNNGYAWPCVRVNARLAWHRLEGSRLFNEITLS